MKYDSELMSRRNKNFWNVDAYGHFQDHSTLYNFVDFDRNNETDIEFLEFNFTTRTLKDKDSTMWNNWKEKKMANETSLCQMKRWPLIERN